MASVSGHPGMKPGQFPHPAELGGKSVVRIGKFADRRNKGSGTVRHFSTRVKSRAFGNSTPGRVTRVGRQSNRSK